MRLDLGAERVVRFVGLAIGRLGRFEAHIVPAEVFQARATLAETLGPHGRASCTLAGQEPGGQRRKCLGFAHRPLTPYWPTTRRPKPPTGRGLAALIPGAWFGAE